MRTRFGVGFGGNPAPVNVPGVVMYQTDSESVSVDNEEDARKAAAYFLDVGVNDMIETDRVFPEDTVYCYAAAKDMGDDRDGAYAVCYWEAP